MTQEGPTWASEKRKQKTKNAQRERQRKREGWSPPLLLLFLKVDGEIATSILLVLLEGMRRWPLPFLDEEQAGQQFKNKAKERGLATSILAILP